VIFAFIIIIGCKSKNTHEQTRDYLLVLDENIYVEVFDTTNTDENRYTDNNTIYKEGNILTYDYYYQDKDGHHFKFEEVEGASELEFRERAKAWRFVQLDTLTEETIDKVILKVKSGLQPFLNNTPDYNQTVISYNFPQYNGERNFNSATGIIENEKNVWMHPPRLKLFRILEINPFPFIQAPYKIGNKWNWTLNIGSFWGDERWRTWDETIENKYQYEIIDKKKIKTKLGDLDCFEIESTATSQIGTTLLKAYFNEDVGFVKLDYTNIDSTKLVLELLKFEKQDTSQ
jgi:hypothetical protein